MKTKYFNKVQKLFCIFFIGLISFASAGIISYADETIYEGPESPITMHDEDHDFMSVTDILRKKEPFSWFNYRCYTIFCKKFRGIKGGIYGR